MIIRQQLTLVARVAMLGDDMNIKALIRKVSVIAFVMAGLIILRLGFDQVQNYKTAAAAIQKGDAKHAIMYFDRVMTAYIPFSPLVGKSRDAVIELGTDLKRKHDLNLALLCFETVRTSIYQTRHLFLPDAGRLKSLNTEIAAIKAEMISGAAAGPGYIAAYDGQMKIAGRDFSPALLPSVFVVIFFAGYLVFVTVWAVSGRRQSAVFGLVMFALWLTALYLA